MACGRSARQEDNKQRGLPAEGSARNAARGAVGVPRVVIGGGAVPLSSLLWRAVVAPSHSRRLPSALSPSFPAYSHPQSVPPYKRLPIQIHSTVNKSALAGKPLSSIASPAFSAPTFPRSHHRYAFQIVAIARSCRRSLFHRHLSPASSAVALDLVVVRVHQRSPLTHRADSPPTPKSTKYQTCTASKQSKCHSFVTPQLNSIALFPPSHLNATACIGELLT